VPQNPVSGRVPETALVGSLLARPAGCPQNPVSGRVPKTSVFRWGSCDEPPFVAGRMGGGADSGTRRDTDWLPWQDGDRFRWTPQIGAIASVLQTATAVGRSGATVSTF